MSMIYAKRGLITLLVLSSASLYKWPWCSVLARVLSFFHTGDVILPVFMIYELEKYHTSNNVHLLVIKLKRTKYVIWNVINNKVWIFSIITYMMMMIMTLIKFIIFKYVLMHIVILPSAVIEAIKGSFRFFFLKLRYNSFSCICVTYDNIVFIKSTSEIRQHGDVHTL